MIQEGGRTRCSELHKFINSIWNKEEFPEQWKGSINVPFIRRVIKQTAVTVKLYHCYQGDKTDGSNCKVVSLLSTT